MIAGLRLQRLSSLRASRCSLIAVTPAVCPYARGDWALIADLDLAILAASWEPSPQDAGGGGWGGHAATTPTARPSGASSPSPPTISSSPVEPPSCSRMLERETRLHTAYFHQTDRVRARENMERELDELAKGRLIAPAGKCCCGLVVKFRREVLPPGTFGCVTGGSQKRINKAGDAAPPAVC